WVAAVGSALVLTLGMLAPVSAGATSPPDGHEAAARLGIESPARAAIERAIDPDDYECGPTQLDAFVGSLVAEMTLADLLFLLADDGLVLDLPTYDAWFFGSDTDSRYALRADYSTLLGKSFRDARRFWDIQSDDIQLHAMHGSMLLDTARVARLLELSGETESEAAAHAASIAQFVANSAALDDGNNPIFTLNAFAFSGVDETDPFFRSIPDKLVMGDGVLDALDWIGIGDVGSRVVLGHEFGHHIQYENDLVESALPGPEATRRTELMADSFATYWGTHRGLSLNAKRVVDAVLSFYVVGDCAFDNDGHHGTPNQRERAAEWGAELAATARPQGHILPSMTVAQRFEEQLPEFVAPDADG
ncbi:MAG TPA: hypothetical protein VF065_18515, partial [Ilumatobacter sp.]